MSSLNSVELNFLVFRYLQESGFTHAAFTLGYEAGINKSNIDGNMVPPGALVKFVQKGLQYMEMEANLSNSEVDIDEDFSFFQPLDLISKDVKELQEMLREKKRKERDREKERDRSKENDKEVEREHEGDRNRAKEKDRHEKQKEREREREKMEREKEREREKIEREKEREREKIERETFERERERLKLEKEREMEREREREKIEREKSHEKQLGDGDREMAIDQTDKENAGDEEHGRATEPMDIVMTATSQPCHIPSSDVRILEGHTSEVCACAWSPSASLLASGSGDATARIWSIPEGSFKSGLHTGRSINALILKHAKSKSNEKSKDVTTLDWNGEGTLLATGSCDGQARIWSTNGELISTLSKHKGPIFSLKWNKKGDYLLTGSVDRTAVVWDVKAEEWKQQFEFHTGPTLDVDWRNNVSFATSSTDSMIYLCKIGETRPVKIFGGHQGEVNCVKWDPTGTLLASCSDDSTAKIWNIKQHTFVHDLREHTKEIYTIRWSPTGAGTNNPNKQLTLASASFDSSVKLWDAELGKLLCSFNGHREPVYSLAFSPNGEYIASGSLDRSIHIWSIKESKIVKTYTGNGGIFEVCWNKEGNKIAACFADNSVCVLDFRMRFSANYHSLSLRIIFIITLVFFLVCACAWSPSASLLASGSADATARIWSIPEGSFKSTGRRINACILNHANGKSNKKRKDVTTLDWNGEGTFLATGSCDGQARIWSTNGDLISTLRNHKGPIFSLKWNREGDYLLTGSADGNAVVWDVKADNWKQRFEFHSGAVLDVDWRNNVSFATSSADSMIYICEIGEIWPVKIFGGHQDEVNCVKWDPTGTVLASCSDDSTAKIWNMEQHTFVHDLREHTKEVYTIRWSPTGPGTNNPNKQLTLASASYDSSVKLWDAELVKMLCSFNGHREAIYSLAFSPNGVYIASGSVDGTVHIWSIKEGNVKTYTGDGGIFEVCWNKEGNKIAACFADNSVCALDFRM